MKNEMNAIRSQFLLCITELRRNLAVIVLLGILGLLVGSLSVVVPQPDVYQATSSISKTVDNAGGQSIAMYQDMLSSKNVLEEMLSLLDGRAVSIGELSSVLDSQANTSGNILYISASHTDADFAVEVANIAAKIVSQQVNRLYTNAGIRVLDEAAAASRVSHWATTAWAYRFVGLLLGLLAGCAIVLIKTLTSKNTLSINACTLDGELELIGVIPLARGGK